MGPAMTAITTALRVLLLFHSSLTWGTIYQIVRAAIRVPPLVAVRGEKRRTACYILACIAGSTCEFYTYEVTAYCVLSSGFKILMQNEHHVKLKHHVVAQSGGVAWLEVTWQIRAADRV